MNNVSYRHSFWILLGLVFLLPLFFIPGAVLSVIDAKAFLAVVAVVLASGFFLWQTWRAKGVIVPKSRLITFLLVVVGAYLLSALLAPVSSMALFGYNLEVGTFGAILVGAILFFLSSIVFAESGRALQVLLASFGSLTILALFVLVRIMTGGSWLQLGNFGGIVGNPLGSFADLGIVFGLLAALSVLALGMLPMKGGFKVVLSGVFLLSTALLVIMNFSQAFLLTFLASVLIFFYFSKVENNFYFHSKGEKGEMGEKGEDEEPSFWSKTKVLPMLLALVSLLFFINPSLSGDSSLGSAVSNATGVSNTDIRPTLSTTLDIAKSVLTQQVLVGSGPNTFDEVWQVYKPIDLNLTPYWSIVFNSGSGFLPTQLVTTGIIGALAWLLFLGALVSLAIKVLNATPESRAHRFIILFSLIASLFLWASFLLYTPSFAVLMLAFLFSGVLLGVSVMSGIVPSHSYQFTGTSGRYLSNTVLGLALVLVVGLGWTELKATLGAYHFNAASKLSVIQDTSISAVNDELEKAVSFAPVDSYFRAISQLNFSTAQVFANSATGTPEVNRTNFETALSKSVSAARGAISVNPAAAENWAALASIYSALVPKPLAVTGAYESAQAAFTEASRRSPNDPSIPLLMAQLELNHENADNAKAYIQAALSLKSNYVEAYILAARIQYALKDYKGVKDILTQALQLDPQNQSIKEAIDQMDVQINLPPPTTATSTKK